MDKEIIYLNDGTEDVAMQIIATFSVDEQDYCCLESSEDGERYLLRMISNDDEMLFETVDDDEEFEDVREAFEELIKENKDKKERTL